MTTLAHRSACGAHAPLLASPARAAAFALACAFAGAAILLLAGCGGGGSPLGNPPIVSNPAGASGQQLSFIYFQKCVAPIFTAKLPININGNVTINTCASSGCHDNVSGTGGALRVVGSAQPVDVNDPTNTPAVMRTTDMYKNFYSAQGATVPGTPTQSRLLQKPLVQNVLHGGGLIFANDQDPNAKLIRYWITHPTPQGQDEFSASASTMFTPSDPKTGTCNTD